jgi:hypothetical protein
MVVVSYIVLQTAATVVNKNGVSPITGDTIRSQLRRKEAPELIGSFKHGKLTLGLWGYKVGKAGTENKHEIPPPHDSGLLFGDAYMVAYSDKTMKISVPFTCDEYAEFYDAAFGGFEDIEEDSEQDSELGSEDDEETSDAEDGEIDEDEIEDTEEPAEIIIEKNDGDLVVKYAGVIVRRGGEDCELENYTY